MDKKEHTSAYILWIFCVFAIVIAGGLSWYFYKKDVLPQAVNAAQKNALFARQQETMQDSMRQYMHEVTKTGIQVAPFTFDAETATHVLVASAKQGMNIQATVAGVMTINDNPTRIVAQLIERNESPALLHEDITITYTIAASPLREGIPEGGVMTYDAVEGAFVADISLNPVAKNTLDPYPLVTLVAFVDGSDIATTQVIAPRTNEIGCATCHAGGYAQSDVTGLSKATAMNILNAHDSRQGTNFVTQVNSGKAVSCTSCHSGKDTVISLSSAIHSAHALAVKERGDNACNVCHASGETSLTVMYRGVHESIGLSCADCHGTMEDHAIALLNYELKRGALTSSKYFGMLKPTLDIDAIKPRQPYVSLPQCQSCHDFEEKPILGDVTAFNKWAAEDESLFSDSKDAMGNVRCISCHSYAHALYPAFNPYDEERDVLQPMQYQQTPNPLGAQKNCAVCHIEPMDMSAHHPLVGE